MFLTYITVMNIKYYVAHVYVHVISLYETVHMVIYNLNVVINIYTILVAS